MNTIFALATTPGRSAIAIVRISGPKTREILAQVAGRVPRPRQASLRTLRHPETREVLDRALILWFPAPGSFTGEDQAELHLHGGPAVIGATLSALSAGGLELASPGDFTRRAFENGKLSLVQAEAVADLVDAETQAQKSQALVQLGGSSTVVHERWRAQLVKTISLTEAAIDFADEALPDDLLEGARCELGVLKRELMLAISDLRGERVRSGYRVALIGEPNAGKSSLLNALAERDASIVTNIPGTTRDVVEVPLVIGGYQVLMADTAGLRRPGDQIEAEGIRRAQAWAGSADLRLLIVDQSQNTFGEEWFETWRPGDMLVLNKQDLPPGEANSAARAWALGNGISAHSSKAALGMVGEVRAALETHIAGQLSGAEPPIATRLRHRRLLTTTVGHIDRSLEDGLGAELFAENLRLAAGCLERITGRVDVEQVLDEIFTAFCIGK